MERKHQMLAYVTVDFSFITVSHIRKILLYESYIHKINKPMQIFKELDLKNPNFVQIPPFLFFTSSKKKNKQVKVTEYGKYCRYLNPKCKNLVGPCLVIN